LARGWAAQNGIHPDVVEALEGARSSPPDDFITHQGWILIALRNAFYRLLQAPSPEELEECLVETVMAGGDTDTNAAIAGALLGAVHGREALPAQWRQMVLSCHPVEGLTAVKHPRPRGFWPADALIPAEHLLVLGAARGRC
jgi:ADP-ribosylglycohydrolase